MPFPDYYNVSLMMYAEQDDISKILFSIWLKYPVLNITQRSYLINITQRCCTQYITQRCCTGIQRKYVILNITQIFCFQCKSKILYSI